MHKKPSGTNTCLRIKNLSVSAEHNNTAVNILKNVSIEIQQGQTVGLIGASGCGKTMTAMAILHLLPDNFIYQIDEYEYENIRLHDVPDMIHQLRGKKISMIFQDATSALNPVISIGRQMSDVIATHNNISQRHAKMSAIEHLEEVGFSDAEKIYQCYVHQLSGGMAQRIMIALALSCQPSLVIADEPTTALDVITQKQVLKLLRDLQDIKKFSLLLISHDIGVVSSFASEIYIMQTGRILQHGSYQSLLNQTNDPYIQSLLHMLPE